MRRCPAVGRERILGGVTLHAGRDQHASGGKRQQGGVPRAHFVRILPLIRSNELSHSIMK
jgi:hypothetical protein